MNFVKYVEYELRNNRALAECVIDAYHAIFEDEETKPQNGGEPKSGATTAQTAEPAKPQPQQQPQQNGQENASSASNQQQNQQQTTNKADDKSSEDKKDDKKEVDPDAQKFADEQIGTAIKYLMDRRDAKETNKTYQGIIQDFNALSPSTKLTMEKTTDENGNTIKPSPWCAAAVSAAYACTTPLKQAFPYTSCNCEKMAEKARSRGMWRNASSDYIPKRGDVIEFEYPPSASSESKNAQSSHHVAIITAVHDSKLSIIEGNYGDKVNVRAIPIQGSHIKGYILPRFPGIDYGSEFGSDDPPLSKYSFADLEPDTDAKPTGGQKPAENSATQEKKA